MMLAPLNLIFYGFASIAVISAGFVITARNPVRSVLSLIVTFFAMAGIWMLLRAEFLSLILILVYVGAVMTLFLFVVMMLNITTEYKTSSFVSYLPFALLVSILITVLLLMAFGPKYFGLSMFAVPAAEPANYNNTENLGMALFTDFVYPFEVAGVILLAAIVAAITLAHRGPLKRKVQDIDKQVAANPSERVRLVNMPSTPKMKPGDAAQ